MQVENQVGSEHESNPEAKSGLQFTDEQWNIIMEKGLVIGGEDDVEVESEGEEVKEGDNEQEPESQEHQVESETEVTEDEPQDSVDNSVEDDVEEVKESATPTDKKLEAELKEQGSLIEELRAQLSELKKSSDIKKLENQVLSDEDANLMLEELEVENENAGKLIRSIQAKDAIKSAQEDKIIQSRWDNAAIQYAEDNNSKDFDLLKKTVDSKGFKAYLKERDGENYDQYLSDLKIGHSPEPLIREVKQFKKAEWERKKASGVSKTVPLNNYQNSDKSRRIKAIPKSSTNKGGANQPKIKPVDPIEEESGFTKEERTRFLRDGYIPPDVR